MSRRAKILQALKDAVAMIEEADVPEDLRTLAFGRALEALLSREADAPQRDAVGKAPTVSPGQMVSRPASGKLGVSAEEIERVVETDEDGVHVLIPRGRLARSKAAAIQQIATLVVAVRQADGGEEWTSQSLVRQATEEMGVEDRSNFATYMKNLEGIRARGSGRSGELKMNAIGFERATNLFRELAEVPSE